MAHHNCLTPLNLLLFHDRIVGMNRPVPDEVILGLLKIKPAHGYELLAFFQSKSLLGRIWTMSTSQLYAVLKRLEREGFIDGREVDVPNAPARMEYSVTGLGDQQLDDWLFESQPSSSIHRIRVIFLSRIFIANILEIPLERIVDAQIQALIIQRDAFEKHSKNEQSDIEALALEFVINQLNAAIDWLNTSNFAISTQDKITTSERNK